VELRLDFSAHPCELAAISDDDALLDDLATGRLTIDDTTDPLLTRLIAWRDAARQGEEK
jgi:hypothetical protein